MGSGNAERGKQLTGFEGPELDVLCQIMQPKFSVRMTKYTLPLNKTRLLFSEAQPRENDAAAPPNLSDSIPNPIGTVVQVTLKSRNASPSKKELAMFAIEQQDITTAIETLMLMHLNGSDKLPKHVVIRDRLLGYTLVGERQKWTYGQRKQFYWGEHPLRSGEDKWVFYFETVKPQVNDAA
ncbi:hypothetical protein K503DRAFT_858200 [Rhizopogon vinicolor AM-OR11-026]|uniref:Uncharacterized protein n=1 Tax=Rhizopogon vinicolor AM-OR11-026 TaxID=1314800 RepID=A0A1B7MU28_9AGAM|nr:hypothetical protein K503DRAFT_858200 [Rhizopogon vinicolor AM-OR11-026]